MLSEEITFDVIRPVCQLLVSRGEGRGGKRRHEGRIENGIMDVDNERGMGDRKPPFPRSSFFLSFDPFQSSSPELVIYATRINYSSL